MTALIIHGHFYQPPRENPWTGFVDPEPSAHPFHDWNERVYAECYRPNTGARMLDQSGTERFVNNFRNLSFDFGPTLLSWMESHHPTTYSRILEADAESVRLRNGHGNAIAQAYSHPILPLCNQRDMRTQFKWGLADFRHRFGRESEAIWLPETACNNAVLNLLIDEGMRFVILAPSQAERIRENGKWRSVEAGEIDTSIAYRYEHSDDATRSITVFFYDQALAGAIAFEQGLASSSILVDKITRASGHGRLVNVATDGESYGHHHKFGDLCLAYAFEVDAPAAGFQVTNYGEYLDQHPAELDVEIVNGPQGEGSSWSCAHGIDRWIRDCGCKTGGNPEWNQNWRGPLRLALDYLRDQSATHFEATSGEVFIDAWKARDAAIEIFLNPAKSWGEFLLRHAPRSLRQDQQSRARLFLEMQRNTLLMYASCGWFFNDISGIEPVQILKYAARAIDIMDQLGLSSPRERFLEILSESRSNRPEMGNGADIYRRMVEPLRSSQLVFET